MKISKLFHWLYASVMLMPIFAIGVKCLYVAFNPNAKDSYGYTDDFTYYEKVDSLMPSSWDSNNCIKEDNFYYINETDWDYFNYFANDDVITFTIQQGDFAINDGSYSIYDYSLWETKTYLYIEMYYDQTYLWYSDLGIQVTNYTTFDFYECIVSITSITNPNYRTLQDISSGFSLTTYYETAYVERTIEHTTLDNAFYYSVHEIAEEPLFSWAANSFINQPIVYITGLFGMPSNSEIIIFLSYWLDISIIWLTFDLLMYVPLLAHRWLDKGSLE